MTHHLLQNGELLSVLTALVWACGVILFRQSGRTVPPVPLNLFKGAVGFVLLLPTLWLAGQPLVPSSATAADWIILAVSGVLGIALADSLFFASLNRLGVVGNAIVDCLYSPAVVLCAVVGLGEPLTPVLLISLALMVLAVFLGTGVATPVPTQGPEAAQEPAPASEPAHGAQRGDNAESNINPNTEQSHGAPAPSAHERRLGVLYGVLGIVLMAVGITMAKPVLNRSSVLWATEVRIGGALIFLAMQGLLPRHRAVVARIFTPGAHWRLLVPASVVGTYLAMIFWIAGMKYTHASVASVLNQTSTLFLPLLGWFFLRERLTARSGAAVLLGFSGAALLALV